MTKKQKRFWLAVAVVPLVGLAGYMSAGYFRGSGAQTTAGPSWQNISEEEREKKLDEAERRRRKMGRGPMRRLPEDPPNAPLPPRKGK